MTEETIVQNNLAITKESLDELLDDILTSGLIIVAIKGHGKSDAAKHIARLFIENRKDVKVDIFDTCLNWRHSFDSIPYIKMENVMQSIPSVKHLLIDVPFSNPKETKLAISTVALKDFDQMSAYKETVAQLPYWNLYIIEETQNVLGTYSLNGFEGEFWLKIVSEGRNFNMNYIGIGQRLADISTKVVERCKSYLFGQLTGDNDIKKVKKIAGENVANMVKVLNRGEFLHYSGCCLNKITFPKFVPKGKPYEFGSQQNYKVSTAINVENLSWVLRK